MYQLAIRGRALVALALIASGLFLSCSKGDDVALAPELSGQRRGPLLDPRTNPLQTYIEDMWEDNWAYPSLGGVHYAHVKTFGQNSNLCPQGGTCYPDDAEFIANHFDIYIWGGTIVGDKDEVTNNDEMLWLQEGGNIPHIRTGYDVNQVNAWLADEEIEYIWSDLLLHYQVNVTGTPGWNPADDTNGNECIEPGEGDDGEPSDPNRSAQCMADARTLQSNGWLKGDVTSPGYIAFRADEAKYLWDTHDIEGFQWDEAAWAVEGRQLDKTFTYFGGNENSPTFPYIEDKYAFVPSVMAQVEDHTGPVVAMANVVNATFAVYDQYQKAHALEHLENIYLEAWITNSGVGLPDTFKRWAMLDDIYTDFLSIGKGVMLVTYDDTPSDRVKLFSLGMFYMINHQMAFYGYRSGASNGPDVDEWQWNPWVGYDIGQPVVNNLGKVDFENQSSTDRFFVFYDGDTFDVLGRQFLRSDNKRVLVLVRLMDSGQTAGADPETISLGGSYKKVLANFGLGSTINQISLSNNEAVILVKQTGSGCSGCDPEG